MLGIAGAEGRKIGGAFGPPAGGMLRREEEAKPLKSASTEPPSMRGTLDGRRPPEVAPSGISIKRDVGIRIGVWMESPKRGRFGMRTVGRSLTISTRLFAERDKGDSSAEDEPEDGGDSMLLDLRLRSPPEADTL